MHDAGYMSLQSIQYSITPALQPLSFVLRNYFPLVCIPTPEPCPLVFLPAFLRVLQRFFPLLDECNDLCRISAPDDVLAE